MPHALLLILAERDGSIHAGASILIFGWISQKQLVRGLSFGAVK